MMTPDEMIERLNASEGVRVCADCGSMKARYDIGQDEIICLECGSTNRKWALKSKALAHQWRGSNHV